METVVEDDPNAAAAGGGDWAKLQISHDSIGSMQYGNMLLKIYEQAGNQRNAAETGSSKILKRISHSKYYYAPITLLDYTSARSLFNNVTNQAEMKFRVEMWNDDVKSKVVDWIIENYDKDVNKNFVQVIPFEKMVLATTSHSFQQRYTLPKVWKNYQSEQVVWFKLICFDKTECDHLANEMRQGAQSASQFSDFQILFSLTKQSSQTKQTIIRVESILEGSMASKLNQRTTPGTESVLVSAKDEQQLLLESATNILIDTFDDSTDVVASNSEAQIYKFLQNLIQSSRVNINKQSDSRIWDSVFWNDDNYRPDKASKTMTEVYRKQDKETQKKMVEAIEQAKKDRSAEEKEMGSSSNASSNSKDEQNRNARTFEDINKIGTSVGGKGWGVKFNAAVDVDLTKKGDEESEEKGNSSNSTSQTTGGSRIAQSNDKEVSHSISLTQEQLDTLFDECKNNVEWDGEKFTPRPLTLVRISLAKLRDEQTYRDRSVRVKYSTAVLSIPVNMPIHSDCDIESINNKFVEIQSQLEGIHYVQLISKLTFCTVSHFFNGFC